MTVIFFCPNILRDAHRYIFELDHLIKEGYKIVLLDATLFYGKNSTAKEKIILNNKVECRTIEDFITFRENLPKEPVLFVSFDNYMKFAAPVLKLLVRQNDKLLSYHTKRFSSVKLSSSKLRILLDHIIKELDKILPLHKLKFFYKWKYKLFIPDYYLCSTSYLIPTKVYFTIKRNRRIIVHSDDVNMIIRREKVEVINKNKKIGVFLDQVIPFQDRLHPALVKNPAPKGYIEEYYKNLKETLEYLRKELGLEEVVIALHPNSVKFKKELSDKFIGFKTFIGVTNELIRDSHLVFGHSSTALGFAIFYKKPIVLLKDNIIMGNPLTLSYIRFFEKNLDINSIPMDSSSKIDFNPFSINKKKYKDYIEKFMKNNQIQENSYFYAINKIKEDLRRN